MKAEISKFLAMKNAGIVVFPNPGDGRWIAYMFKPGEVFGYGVAGDTAEEAITAYGKHLEESLLGEDWGKSHN